MPGLTVGTVKRVRPDIAAIAVSLGSISDEATATPETEGFSLLSQAGEGGRVVVEVELIPPRTSTLTHVRIIKILNKVARPSPETA